MFVFLIISEIELCVQNQAQTTTNNPYKSKENLLAVFLQLLSVLNQKTEHQLKTTTTITIIHTIARKRSYQNVKRETKNIKQKNRAQKKLEFRDTSTKSARFRQYLYTVRRGRQEGRNLVAVIVKL